MRRLHFQTFIKCCQQWSNIWSPQT